MGDNASVGLTIQDFNDMASRYNALQIEYTVLKKYVKELEHSWIYSIIYFFFYFIEGLEP